MPLPWDHLPDTTSRLLSPAPALLVGAALVTPLAFVPTGLDHDARRFAQADLGGSYDPEPVSVAAPFVVSGGLVLGYVASALTRTCEASRVQAAVLQAVTVSAATMLALKFVTGRYFPNTNLDPGAAERLDDESQAKQFRPFALELSAWPSGHTTVMVAAAAALRTSWPRGGALRWLGYPLAAGVAAGMWLGDHHWMSDIVSGALLGEAIGGSAGAAFASASRASSPAAFLIVPVRGGSALALSGAF